MKRIILLAAIAAILGACTSSKEITVTSNVTIEIDTRTVLEPFTPWSQGGFDMWDGSMLGVYCFFYDMDGNLVESGNGLFDEYVVAEWDVESLPHGEYQVVAVSFASDDEISSYAIKDYNDIESLKIYQNTYNARYSNWSCLGVAYQKVHIGGGDVIRLELEPAGSFVNLTYKNMVAISDKRVDGVKFYMKANDIFGYENGGYPTYSTQLAQNSYYITSSDMPSGDYTGIYEILFLLPCESMQIEAAYLMGEESILYFGETDITIKAGKQYEITIDCPNKTISTQTKSSASSEGVCQNPRSLDISDYFGISE